VLSLVARNAPGAPTGTSRRAEDADTPVIDRRRIDQLLELQDKEQPTMVADLIALFIADTPRHFEHLAQAIRDRDAERMANAAHRYLSSIENLGARRMRTYCMELENLGRAGSTTGAEAGLELLRQEFEQARDELTAIAARSA
jgi:HPt (histidine-containing phosphotransfer) domain-containing protein